MVHGALLLLIQNCRVSLLFSQMHSKFLRMDSSERRRIVFWRHKGIKTDIRLSGSMVSMILPLLNHSRSLSLLNVRGSLSPQLREITSAGKKNASDNLAQMLEDKKYPKTTLTAPPKRYAQMLIVAGDKILLGKHTRGEFAERFTGFIVEIEQDSELAPIDCARTGAVRRAGLNPVAFDALNQDLDIREIGRFRFTGWIPDTLVVEHEFVAVFDDAALALLFQQTKSKSSTKTTVDMIPTWFSLDEIPYADMPEDDEKWYSCCLNVAGVSTTGRDVTRVVDQLVIGHFHFENDALASWSTVAVPFKAPERIEMYRLV
jgi:hypothetical protein